MSYGRKVADGPVGVVQRQDKSGEVLIAILPVSINPGIYLSFHFFILKLNNAYSVPQFP